MSVAGRGSTKQVTLWKTDELAEHSTMVTTQNKGKRGGAVKFTNKNVLSLEWKEGDCMDTGCDITAKSHHKTTGYPDGCMLL